MQHLNPDRQISHPDFIGKVLLKIIAEIKIAKYLAIIVDAIIDINWTD